jgi:ABC-type antimicrobial peptide transport system permease subunit
VLFIVGALAIHQQIKFVQKKYLGYNRENIISFSMGHNKVDPKIFIAELQNLPGVINAGQISSSILQRTGRNSGFSWTGNEAENDISFWSPRFGLFAMETLNMELLAGRSFRESDGNDDSKVIINESARQMMRLEDPIGFKLGIARDKEIIGVVRDFQYGSLHDPIEPLILRFRRWGREIIVRIKSGTESETIAAIEQLHSKFHPGYPFDFTFMDDDYETLYKSEQTVASLSNYFSILAIIISCLGLFGLSTYTAERKAKEISIRKILGASIIQVVSLLAKDFIQTICIGLLIGIPLSYVLLKRWLGNFAYHIDLEWWLFALAAGFLLCIAIATIGIQTVRAATMNPVASLKDE